MPSIRIVETQMPENSAAWLKAKHARLEVSDAPRRSPCGHEILVRNHAVSVNPVDWITQLTGAMIFPWLAYPAILGSDVSGEVVEVGQDVIRFKVGDRVVGHALGLSKNRCGPAEGGFQIFTILIDHMAAPIPDALAYENAAVLPLGLSTAACGLFQKDHLALQLPAVPPKPTGKTLLIWGGSTSVGSNAIQLAVAAGYDVVTTASPRNFDYVRRLGAREVFDYASKSAAKDIIGALAGKTLAGALAIGKGSAPRCVDVVRASAGAKVVSVASPGVSFETLPEGGGVSAKLIGLMAVFVTSALALAIRSRLGGVRTKSIFGDTLADNMVGPAIYVDYLPKALADGVYKAAPDPVIVGVGLSHVQEGFELQKKGVSAKKVVILV